MHAALVIVAAALLGGGAGLAAAYWSPAPVPHLADAERAADDEGGPSGETDPGASLAARLAMEANDLIDTANGRAAALRKAAETLDAALEASEKEAVVHVVAARLTLERGYLGGDRYQPDAVLAAERSLQRAVALDPRLGRAYTLRAHLFTATGRIQAAKADLAAAEAFGYASPWLLTNRAAILKKEGQADAAAAVYREIIARFGDDARAVATASGNLRAYHAARREREAAESYYRRQIELQPDNPVARGNWARELLTSFGDADAAIDTAREALRLNDYQYARQTLALGLYAKWAAFVADRRPDTARPYFEEAQRLWPDRNDVAATARAVPALQPVALALAPPPQDYRGGWRRR